MAAPTGGPRGSGESGPDYPLTPGEASWLLHGLAETFNSEQPARMVLHQVPFPRAMIPAWGDHSLHFWTEVFVSLDNGTVTAPFRKLIAAVLSIYPQHPVCTTLERQYQEPDLPALLEEAPGHPQLAGPVRAAGLAPGPAFRRVTDRARGCHAIVRTEDEREQKEALGWLANWQLDPEVAWSEHEMTSFEVSDADQERVRALVYGQYGKALVKVIPPGEPDTVIDSLCVRDMNGRELIVRRVPRQITVAELAAIAARSHPAVKSTFFKPPSARPEAENAEHVGNGITQGVPMDGTLADWGFAPSHRVTIKSLTFQPISVVSVGACSRENGARHPNDMRVGRELDNLRNKNRQLRNVNFREFPHATRGDLAVILQELADPPDILHIACDSEDGFLYWEDDSGNPAELPADWLAGNITDRLGRKLSGIVLSTPDGESIARYLTAAAREVIRLPATLADNTAGYLTAAVREVIPYQGMPADNVETDPIARFYDELDRTSVLRTAAWRAFGSVFRHDPLGDS
jgi:Effector-associated domain 1